MLQMKAVAAYLLCVLGGNATPSADDVSGIITAIGGEADDATIASLISNMKGKVSCCDWSAVVGDGTWCPHVIGAVRSYDTHADYNSHAFSGVCN